MKRKRNENDTDTEVAVRVAYVQLGGLFHHINNNNSNDRNHTSVVAAVRRLIHVVVPSGSTCTTTTSVGAWIYSYLLENTCENVWDTVLNNFHHVNSSGSNATTTNKERNEIVTIHCGTAHQLRIERVRGLPNMRIVVATTPTTNRGRFPSLPQQSQMMVDGVQLQIQCLDVTNHDCTTVWELNDPIHLLATEMETQLQINLFKYRTCSGNSYDSSLPYRQQQHQHTICIPYHIRTVLSRPAPAPPLVVPFGGVTPTATTTTTTRPIPLQQHQHQQQQYPQLQNVPSPPRQHHHLNRKYSNDDIHNHPTPTAVHLRTTTTTTTPPHVVIQPNDDTVSNNNNDHHHHSTVDDQQQQQQPSSSTPIVDVVVTESNTPVVIDNNHSNNKNADATTTTTGGGMEGKHQPSNDDDDVGAFVQQKDELKPSTTITTATTPISIPPIPFVPQNSLRTELCSADASDVLTIPEQQRELNTSVVQQDAVATAVVAVHQKNTPPITDAVVVVTGDQRDNMDDHTTTLTTNGVANTTQLDADADDDDESTSSDSTSSSSGSSSSSSTSTTKLEDSSLPSASEPTAMETIAISLPEMDMNGKPASSSPQQHQLVIQPADKGDDDEDNGVDDAEKINHNLMTLEPQLVLNPSIAAVATAVVAVDPSTPIKDVVVVTGDQRDNIDDHIKTSNVDGVANTFHLDADDDDDESTSSDSTSSTGSSSSSSASTTKLDDSSPSSASEPTATETIAISLPEMDMNGNPASSPPQQHQLVIQPVDKVDDDEANGVDDAKEINHNLTMLEPQLVLNPSVEAVERQNAATEALVVDQNTPIKDAVVVTGDQRDDINDHIKTSTTTLADDDDDESTSSDSTSSSGSSSSSSASTTKSDESSTASASKIPVPVEPVPMVTIAQSPSGNKKMNENPSSPLQPHQLLTQPGDEVDDQPNGVGVEEIDHNLTFLEPFELNPPIAVKKHDAATVVADDHITSMDALVATEEQRDIVGSTAVTTTNGIAITAQLDDDDDDDDSSSSTSTSSGTSSSSSISSSTTSEIPVDVRGEPASMVTITQSPMDNKKNNGNHNKTTTTTTTTPSDNIAKGETAKATTSASSRQLSSGGYKRKPLLPADQKIVITRNFPNLKR